MTRGQLARAAAIIAFLTILSKPIGFIREASLASLFGATFAADAYLMALTIPSLLFTAISQAIGISFIPVYSKIGAEEGKEAAFRTANTAINVTLVVAVLLVIGAELLAPALVSLVAPGFEGAVRDLTIVMVRILLPVIVFQAVSGVMIGVLQAEGNFTVPAAADFAHNVLWVAAIVVLGSRYGIVPVAAGTLAAMAVPTFMKMPAIFRLGLRWRPTINLRDPGLRQMGLLILPAIVGAGATQLNVIVDRVLASGLPEGRIAALNYASRLTYLVPSIVGTTINTVIFPTLARMAARKEWAGYAQGVADALSLIHFLLLPVAVWMALLRTPIIRIVFERGAFDAAATEATAWALLYLSPIVVFSSMSELLNRSFFALHDSKTPMRIGLAAVGVNIVLNLLLIGPLEHGGLALGTSMATLFGVLVLLWSFRRTSPTALPLRRLGRSVFGTVFASGAMGLVLWLGLHYVEGFATAGFSTLALIGRVVLITAVGGIVYGLVAGMMRVQEVATVRKLLAHGLQRLHAKSSG